MSFAERLHAIDTTTGLELQGSPFDIGTALKGLGFSIIVQNQRAGLALSHPTGSPNLANIYVAWASNCDYNQLGNYDGWIAGFQLNYNSLSSGFKTLGTFITEPLNAQHEGGIWMAGSAPAIDGNGNVYAAVANGDVNPPSQTSGQWGNSVMKLSSKLTYEDFYTPNDWDELDGGGNVCFAPSTTTCPPGYTQTLAPKGDTDMGTGGVVLLSNSSPTELVSVGKQGIVYVIRYDTTTSSSTTMGGLDGCGYVGCSTQSNPQNTACSISTLPSPGYIAQCFDAMPIADFTPDTDLNGIRGAPAFWSAGATSPNQYLFAIGLHDRMYWFKYPGPTFNTANPPQSDHVFDAKNPGGQSVGGTASITWNGTSTSSAVAWALDSNGYGRQYPNVTPPFECSSPAVLYAYPAVPGSPGCSGDICELWDSKALSASMPGAVKFTVPTVVDGYILIGGGTPNYFATPLSSDQRCQVVSACDPANFPSCAGQLTILGIAPK